MILLALVVFFSVAGTLRASSVYRHVVQELGNPPRLGVRWIDMPGLLLLAIIPGLFLLFAPRRVETNLLFGAVLFLREDGAITNEQARDYLRTKGIEYDR